MENTGTKPILIKTVQWADDAEKHNIHPRELMSLAMILSDLAGILLSVALAGTIRTLFLGPMTLESYLWVPAFIAIFVMAAQARKLYPAVGMSAIEQFRNLTMATSLFMMVIIAGTFFFHISGQYSRLLIAISWLFCIVILPFNRTVVRHYLAQSGLWGEPVAVIGTPEGVERVANYYSRYPKIGIKPEVVLYTQDVSVLTVPEVRKQFSEQLAQIQALSTIKTVLVTYDNLVDFPAIRELYRDLFETVIIISPTDCQIDLGGVNVRQYGDLLAFEVHHSLVDQSAQIQKRLIDLFISGLGLLILSPFLAIVALLIKMDSPGSVFYTQKRLGKNGRVFNMLKFRTMHKDADLVLNTYLESHPAAALEWKTYQKLQKDPRITNVGRFLRRFSLDELPQLINVCLGEMSIVGPRPIMLNQREIYGVNFTHYMRVVPGITGLWQISGRNHTSFAQRVKFDVEYVNTWSIWMDIYIIVRTAWVIICRNGAY